MLVVSVVLFLAALGDQLQPIRDGLIFEAGVVKRNIGACYEEEDGVVDMTGLPPCAPEVAPQATPQKPDPPRTQATPQRSGQTDYAKLERQWGETWTSKDRTRVGYRFYAINANTRFVDRCKLGTRHRLITVTGSGKDTIRHTTEAFMFANLSQLSPDTIYQGKDGDGLNFISVECYDAVRCVKGLVKDWNGDESPDSSETSYQTFRVFLEIDQDVGTRMQLLTQLIGICRG